VRCDLFRELPSRVDYPDYYAVIARPLALATLRVRGRLC
jgi:ATP-dependent helicase STH1/SNF2